MARVSIDVHVLSCILYSLFFIGSNGETMGSTCNKLLQPEDVAVGATVGKYLWVLWLCGCIFQFSINNC